MAQQNAIIPKKYGIPLMIRNDLQMTTRQSIMGLNEESQESRI
jgi:hypothetical protein